MSARVVEWARAQKLVPSMAILLQCLANASDDAGICGVHSVRALATCCGISSRTVHRKLALLERGGWIHIERRWSPEGLQSSSQYRLLVNRAATDQRFLHQCDHDTTSLRRGPDSTAAGSDNVARPAADKAKRLRAPTRPAMDGTANASVREISGCVTMAKRAANLADKKHTAKAVVCIETTTDDDVSNAQLTQRLSTEMCFDPQQIARIYQGYPEPHIGAVIDYVAKRYLSGKVHGNIAPYFLATIKQATAESLGLTRSVLGLSRAAGKSPKCAVADDVVDDIAKAKRDEPAERKLHAKAFLDSLSADEQARLVARYWDWQYVDNPIVFHWTDRRGILVSGFAHNLLLIWIADGYAGR